MSVSEEHIVWCYRILLAREPESYDVVSQKKQIKNLHALVEHVLESKEFKSKHKKKYGFSQNGEDIILEYALSDISCGFYIDIGANDPTQDSVTKLFYEKGWSGINIEPIKEHYESLKIDRPRDVNLNIGCGAQKSTQVFYKSSVTGWSTFDKNRAMHIQNTTSATIEEQTMSVVPLNEIVSCYAKNYNDIDFLKIDVEGYESAIINSTNWTIFRPRIIVIESTPLQSETWRDTLLKAAYEPALYDLANYYFVRKEDRTRIIVDCYREKK